jgi:hypothetical protein
MPSLLTHVLAAALQTTPQVAAEQGDVANDWWYVAAAYGLTIVVIAAYAVWTVRRGRAVGGRLPAEDRRWM